MNFEESWRYLEDHPAFKNNFGHSLFSCELYIGVQLIDPALNEVNQDDESKNTQTMVSLEHGPWTSPDDFGWSGCSHNPSLDVWAPTFEEAIVKLATRVEEYYTDLDLPPGGFFYFNPDPIQRWEVSHAVRITIRTYGETKEEALENNRYPFEQIEKELGRWGSLHDMGIVKVVATE